MSENRKPLSQERKKWIARQVRKQRKAEARKKRCMSHWWPPKKGHRRIEFSAEGHVETTTTQTL